jgi:signal transduction histidine kinase
MADEVAESLSQLRGLADQQEALRRVAMLTAQGAEPERLFGAIAVEAARILGVEAISLISYDAEAQTFTQIAATHGPRAVMPNGGRWPLRDSPLGQLIIRTGRPGRIDDWAGLPGPIAARHREHGLGQAVTAPIMVNGTLWGHIAAFGDAGEVLPPGCETRLADFTHLMATAIANVQARDQLRSLAEQQGALRRVATLVAQGAEPRTVFTAVAIEVSRLLGVGAVSLISYDADAQTFTEIFGTHGERSAAPDGSTWPLADFPEGALAIRTGRPARVDDWTGIPGEIAARHVAEEFGQAVAAPIIVDGEIWGYMAAYGEAGEILPSGCEVRLADYTNLMATAIANVQARNLAESQGALRRVATLVAQGAEPRAVFTAVAIEVSRLLGVGAVSLISYDAETQTFTKIFGTHGQRSPVPDGTTWPVDDCPEGVLVIRTGRPGRVDDWTSIPGEIAAQHVAAGFGQAMAAPIVVDGEIWGHMAAYGEAHEILPPGSETRLADYTNLMASAIGNAQARDELRSLAEQQGAALRRVATLVAQQASLSTIFNAVAREASQALRVPRVDVGRCHEDGSVTLLGSTAQHGPGGDGTFARSGECVAAMVRQTGRAARIDNWTALPAPDAAAARREGFQSAAGAPIFVEGALWGVIVVLAGEILRTDAETRLSDFTHLVASSISNVHARNNLIASRARIVTASDETRRRIERNLHDGIQQRILALGLSLRAVRAGTSVPQDLVKGLDEVAHDLDGVLEEIRVFSQGLHPALLSRSGLSPSLRALARRSPISVDLDADAIPRLPEPVETAVYYVVSEALANAAKYSRATVVSVAVAADPERVTATVADDGVGGATLGRGSGLIGLVDRVEALGGRLTLDSPAGRGTTVSIELPLGSTVVSEQAAL